MKILLTGFNAFGKVRSNPSQQIVEHFAALPRPPRRVQLITKVLPTEYVAATRQIRRLIRASRPDAILCLGVAPARKAISLERVALNLDDSAQPDNAGTVRRNRPIVPHGPAAYWSTLPLDAFRRTLQRSRLPVQFSSHAGGFVCNHIFYQARHEVARSQRAIPCGFIHLPKACAPSAKASTALPLPKMIRAIERCLEVLAKTSRRKKRAS